LDKEEQRRFIEIATKHQPGWWFCRVGPTRKNWV
jgi:hypothetical protein